MSDRFKFRVWFNNQFWYSDNVFHFQNQHETNIVDLLNSGFSISDLDQCTGLRDKNGVLIWEGDVVKCEFSNKPCIVHYGVGTFDSMHYKFMGFFLVRIGDHPKYEQYEDTNFGDSDFSKWYEVIGNIYENPELLEQ